MQYTNLYCLSISTALLFLCLFPSIQQAEVSQSFKQGYDLIEGRVVSSHNLSTVTASKESRLEEQENKNVTGSDIAEGVYESGNLFPLLNASVAGYPKTDTAALDSENTTRNHMQPHSEEEGTGDQAVNFNPTGYSRTAIRQFLFPGIGFTNVSLDNDRNVTASTLDTGMCRRYTLGSTEHDCAVGMTWQQQGCLSRNIIFSDSFGEKVDLVFLSDTIASKWVLEAPDVWRWFASRVINGNIANLGCEILEASNACKFASELLMRTPISPKVWVVSVGFSDCIAGTPHSQVTEELVKTVQALRYYNCFSHVVLSAILPFVPAEQDIELSWDKSPYRSCVKYTNAALKQFASENSAQGITFVDCSDIFLVSHRTHIDPNLVPDGIHLSRAGYERYAACLGERLARYSGLRRSKYREDFDFEAQSSPAPWSESPSFDWRFSEWRNCSAECGAGVQTRSGVCVDRKGGEVSDERCNPVTLKLLRTCNNGPCPMYGFVVGHWSNCSSPCGGGFASRTVVCMSSAGGKVDYLHCDQVQPRPAASKACNTQPCHEPSQTLDPCRAMEDCQGEARCPCFERFHGERSEQVLGCPGGAGASNGCCGSGAHGKGRPCLPEGSVLDRHGNTCPASKLDACGVCNGMGASIDVFGRCCSGVLDASGVCCAPGRLDECGVCAGSNFSCGFAATAVFDAESLAELEVLVESDLRPALAGRLSRLGVRPGRIRVASMALSPRERRAEVRFSVSPSAEPGAIALMTVSSFEAAMRQPGQPGRAIALRESTTTRVPACGNGVCEAGERTGPAGGTGSCPADCPLPRLACPTGGGPAPCSGKGVCVPASGACDCWPGHAGEACELCDGGFVRMGARDCVPLPPPQEGAPTRAPPGAAAAGSGPPAQAAALAAAAAAAAGALAATLLTLAALFRLRARWAERWMASEDEALGVLKPRREGGTGSSAPIR